MKRSPVGLRHRRSVVIAAVVKVDYLRFRFANAPWLPALPRLDALAERAKARASFAQTLPRDMPAA